MKQTKIPNINAGIYEGQFQLLFDCPGLCRFALCSAMPPDGTEECAYRENGSCLLGAAKMAAIEALRRRLARDLKTLGDEIDSE